MLVLVPFLAVLALAGCPAYSTNPDIAMKQKWLESCGQMKQSILTGLELGTAGHLRESEAQVLDRVNVVYVSVCSAEPAQMTDILKTVAVKAAVGELCPELVISDDVVVTAAEAAACAARKALLLQLEASA